MTTAAMHVESKPDTAKALNLPPIPRPPDMAVCASAVKSAAW